MVRVRVKVQVMVRVISRVMVGISALVLTLGC